MRWQGEAMGGRGRRLARLGEGEAKARGSQVRGRGDAEVRLGEAKRGVARGGQVRGVGEAEARPRRGQDEDEARRGRGAARPRRVEVVADKRPMRGEA